MYQEHSRQLSSAMPISYSAQKLGLFVTSPSIHASPSSRVPRLRFPRLRVSRPWVFKSLSLQVPKSSRPRVFTSPSLRVPRPTSPRPTSPRPMFPRPTSPSLTSPSLTSPSLTSPVPVPVSLFVSLILLTRLLLMRSLKNTAHVSK